MIIIPAPVRPDLDCIAGSFAYADLLNAQGRQAKVWLTGTPDGEAQFYLDKYPQFAFASDEEGQQAEAFVLVDFSELFAMPEGFDRLRVTEIIDHRFPADVHENFPNAKVQLEKVGAAATLVAERLREAGHVPSPELATMVYGAIYSNTLCLKGSLAMAQDKAAAEWLKSVAPDCDRYIVAQLKARSAEVLADVPGALIAETKYVPSRFGDYGFSQFEISKGREFWSQYGAALMLQMNEMPKPIVLNLIDLDGPSSLVYCSDQRFRNLLPVELVSDGNVNRAEPALMRKEIAPYFR